MRFCCFLISFVGVWVLSFPSVVPFCLPLPLPTALITPICPVDQTRPVLPSSSQPAALASRVASLLSSLAFLVGVLQVQDRRCLYQQRQKICWSVTSCAGKHEDHLGWMRPVSYPGTYTHVSHAPSILSWCCPHDPWHSRFSKLCSCPCFCSDPYHFLAIPCFLPFRFSCSLSRLLSSPSVSSPPLPT